MISSHGLDKLLDFSETVNLEKLRSNPQIKSGQPLEKNVSNNNEPQKCAYKPSNENVDTLGPPQPCAYDSSNNNTDIGCSTSTSLTEIINQNMHSII